MEQISLVVTVFEPWAPFLLLTYFVVLISVEQEVEENVDEEHEGLILLKQ